MNHNLISRAVLATALLGGAVSAQQPTFFDQIASFGVQGGIAEIVSANGTGTVLAFSDADAGRVGFVDITDPTNPIALPDVVTGGEPTSVSFSGDLLVAAVLTTPWGEDDPAPDPTDPANAGQLFVIDAQNPAAPVVLGTVAIGFQPDSVKLIDTDNGPVAIVCIENEPIVVDNAEIVLDEDIPGFPTSGPNFPQDRSEAGFVQVISIDTNNVAASTVATVTLPESLLTNAGLLFPTDPQPEFVDVFGTTAAISLQENNGIAILDIADPNNPSLTRVFSLGNAAERLTDICEDDAISLDQGYPSSIGGSVDADEDGSGNPILGGPRQPDAIGFTPDGTVILSADEGELNRTGGRGWSSWDINGNVIYEDAGRLEEVAVVFGQYPDGRSENRGIEIEGITSATFNGRDYAFVVSERGSFIGVYNIQNPANPRLTQVLPTGISPEGIVALPARDLLVTADESSGTLTIYQASTTFPDDATMPLTFSFDVPFGGMSGFDGTSLGFFAVPDNALPTAINFVQTGSPFTAFTPLQLSIPVTIGGEQQRYDGEGVVRDRSILAPFGGFLGGFFIASEGNGSSRPNLIVQTNLFGEVLREIQLPANIDAAADASIGGNAVASAGAGTIRGNGFEGVTLSNDGRYLYACIQRQFNSEAATHTRIARYDLTQIQDGSAPNSDFRTGGDWEFFYYPLEAATGAGFIGLSEITMLPNGDFLVIERDQGIGAETALKAVYTFSLAGLVPDANGVPDAADTVSKSLVLDVQAEFFPFEKVEGLALIGGELWVGLDNDGGETENRVVNTGPLTLPGGN
ncbi:MAG: esterase-like activity of phytase family protein [Planctomycetota bacterium]